MRAEVAAARVGRLATVTPEGQPHVVPCCFAVVGEEIVTAVDGKPKSTLALRRLENIRAHPAASLLVDHYDDDWQRLWWVRVDGTARVVEDEHVRAAAIDALREKYAQYRAEPPSGAVVSLAIGAWRGWSYDDARAGRTNP